MAEIPLQNLVTAIGEAVQLANDKLEYNTVNQFQSHFDEKFDEDGNVNKLSPKAIPFNLPAGDGSDKVVNVPTAALMHHDSLSLSNVKVEINLRSVTWNNDKSSVMVNVGSLEKEDENNDHMASAVINLEFNLRDNSEGKARTYDSLIKHI